MEFPEIEICPEAEPINYFVCFEFSEIQIYPEAQPFVFYRAMLKQIFCLILGHSEWQRQLNLHF